MTRIILQLCSREGVHANRPKGKYKRNYPAIYHFDVLPLFEVISTGNSFIAENALTAFQSIPPYPLIAWLIR